MLRLKQSIQFTSVVLFTFFLSAIPELPVDAGEASDECSPSYSSNQTCTGTVANGTKVYSVTGHFNYSSQICYWHYTMAFYNKRDPQPPYDSPVTTAAGPVSTGCNTQGTWAKGWAPYFNSYSNGAVCALLYRRNSSSGSNIYVDAACANIPL